MSASRRTTILEGMFLDIATNEDRAKVDDLYNRGQKGSATVLMLKRVRDVWVELINKEYKRKPFVAVSMPSRRAVIEEETDDFFIPRLMTN